MCNILIIVITLSVCNNSVDPDQFVSSETRSFGYTHFADEKNETNNKVLQITIQRTIFKVPLKMFVRVTR